MNNNKPEDVQLEDNNKANKDNLFNFTMPPDTPTTVTTRLSTLKANVEASTFLFTRNIIGIIIGIIIGVIAIATLLLWKFAPSSNQDPVKDTPIIEENKGAAV